MISRPSPRSGSIPTTPTSSSSPRSGMYGAPDDERGVFKSTDGGKTWRRVLFRDDRTGGHRHLHRPRQPPGDVCRALGSVAQGVLDVERRPGERPLQVDRWRRDAGPRSPGIPACRPASIGKIGVSVSGADPNRVYAEIENDNGGLFRSDDAGATWTLVNSGRNIRQRAFYYTHVTADPHNKDLVYVQNVGTLRSTDGGKTMTNYCRRRFPRHVDRPGRLAAHAVCQRRWRRRDLRRARRTRLQLARLSRPPRSTMSWRPRHVPYQRLRRPAGRQHGLRAERCRRWRRPGRRPRRRRAGHVQCRRRGTGLHRARSEGSGHLLRRRQQRLVPHAAQPAHGRGARGGAVSAHVLRRTVERAGRTLAVDLSRSSSRRSTPTSSTPRRSMCGRRPTAARAGTGSRRTSPATIRRRWGCPAARSRTT